MIPAPDVPARLVVLPGAHPGGLTVTLVPHPDDRDRFAADLAEAGRTGDTALAAAEGLFRERHPDATSDQVEAHLNETAAVVRGQAPGFRAAADRALRDLIALLTAPDVAARYVEYRVLSARADALEQAGA